MSEFIKLYNLTRAVFCMPIKLFKRKKKEEFPPLLPNLLPTSHDLQDDEGSCSYKLIKMT